MEGEWLTDHLRALWREGSFGSAWRIWCSGLVPEKGTPSPKVEKAFFQLVSGKTKLTGWASDEGGFNMVKDDSGYKCIDTWDLALEFLDHTYTVQLMDSLVLSRGLARMFYEERDLDEEERLYYIRSNENYRKKADKAKEEYILTAIAAKKDPLPKGIPREIHDILLLNTPTTEDINKISVIYKIVKDKFKHYDMYLPSISSITECLQSFTKTSTMQRNIGKLGKISKTTVPDTPSIVQIPILGNLPAQKISVQDHIAQIVAFRHHKFEPEDLKTTTFTSGFLDLDGNFYGCGSFQHVHIEDMIVSQFNLKIKDKESAERSVSPYNEIIEQNGWIKVSCSRFYWNIYKNKPNASQIDSMVKLMAKWELTETEFGLGEHMTLEEALANNDQELDIVSDIGKYNEATGIERLPPSN